jgi:hypothetical protein
MENTTPATKAMIIKSIYFYLVSFVALMMVAFSSADLINMALKTWIFTKADKLYLSRGLPYGAILRRKRRAYKRSDG